MKRIKINIRLEEGCSIHPSLPTYHSKDAAGCDLCYCGSMPVTLYTFDRAFIHTGVHIALPDGYEAQVRGRSGLNRNHGIVVPTGTIDADYRGDIGVVVYNLSREPFTINPGDRIAQLVISPVIQAEWQLVESLDQTERGDGGFGSTGK